MKKLNRKSVTTRATENKQSGVHQLKPLAGAIAAWAKYPGNWSFLVGALPAVAMAQLPTGGAVVAGSATITTPDANKMVVQQSSNKAIYNWQSFSIGSNGYVQFVQPGSSSIALNRVVGADPSSILGQLSSNGQIFLVNPNGVFFGANAVVDVAGIVATTMNIRDEDFMRGDYRFFRDPNTAPGATVINQGALNAASGYVVLAGDYVNNTGVIQAQLGIALLASGESLTMQLAGSTLINYAVDKATVAHLAGVSNAGQILANGGRVIMTADVANDLAATVVNNSGLIEAQSTVERNGAIYFEGNGGSVANSGTLDASAQAGANGGHVDVRASGDIHHEAGSLIEVSGADTGESDAGSLYTWADGTNRFKQGASILGKGGAESGDGAFVELSGKSVTYRGDLDLLASNGKSGTLLIDPTHIVIRQGDVPQDVTLDEDVYGSEDPDGDHNVNDDTTTFYETTLENALKGAGDVQLVAQGEGASILMEDLNANDGDGVLDGTNVSGTGGSLTMTASGSGASITFANKDNTIKVDRNLTVTATDGQNGYNDTSIDVGNLVAGQGNPTGGGLNDNATWTSSMTLDAGSITAKSMTLGKNIESETNAAYNLNAHAHAGNLTVNGDVTVEVSNTKAASVKTNTVLRADGGDVIISGNVKSNATGQGYRHSTWDTSNDGCETGNATSCYSTYADRSQPWKETGNGDHAIGTALVIIADSGNVNIGGTTTASATDQNSAFTGNGGFWKTASNSSRIFWRPTAATATAEINAGGNAEFGQTVNVKADGYANASYGETESWNDMIEQRLLVNNVLHNYQERELVEGEYEWVNKSDYEDGVWQGGYTGNFVWSQSWKTINQGEQGHRTYSDSDSHSASGSTAMSYSGLNGIKATLELTAGGNVTMNGLDVTSTNRSVNGNGTYSDAFWGHQDSSNVNTGLPSAVREVNYDDDFATRFTAATSTATVNISAGDNKSITMNAGEGVAYDVISEHSNITASSNNLAGATMTLTAGQAGGASGAGKIQIDGAVTVSGAKDAEVSLSIRNYDGDIEANDAITVDNDYDAHDGRATIRSDVGSVDLTSVAVEGGRSAYLTVNAADSLQITGASSAVVTGGSSTGTAAVDLDGTNGVAVGDLTATSTHMFNTTSNNDIYGHDQSIDGGTASIDVLSTNGNVDLNGDVIASGYKTASVVAAASGAGRTLTTEAGKAVNAITSGQPASAFQSYSHHSITVPTYTAGVTLSANGGMTVDSSVGATVTNHNGAATIALTTTGGSTATISQGQGSVVKADGMSAAVTINAGSAEPTAANAATVDLNGGVQAYSTSGIATVDINAKSGSVADFGAESTGNVATVDITALDGALVLDGTGEVTGNANSATGSRLTVEADSIDASASDISVANNNTGNVAGAKAVLTAGNGTAILGAAGVSTSGNGVAALTATSTGDLSTAGNLSATATSNGTASITLTSSAGDMSLGHDVTAAGKNGASVAAGTTSGNLNQTAGTVLASTQTGTAETTLTSADVMTVDGTVSANAVSGSANASLLGKAVPSEAGDAVIVNGKLIAHSDEGTATASLATDGGGNASIKQGSNGVIRATGGAESIVAITAGGAGDSAAAFDMGGALHAGYDNSDNEAVSSGAASITVEGKSGSIKDFSARSSAHAASASFTASGAGDADRLALNGVGSVVGVGQANIDATAQGQLDVNGTLSASLESPSQSINVLALIPQADLAEVKLTSNTGKIVLDGEGSVTATAENSGDASVALTASEGIQADGDATATAHGGQAAVTLDSTGDIVLNGALSAMGSSHGSVKATAEDGGLTHNTGATVHAGATDGSASVEFLSGGAMTVNGDIVAAATDDGTAHGEHTGFARVDLTTTGIGNVGPALAGNSGTAAADITQGSASTISAVGSSALMTIVAGKVEGDPVAAFNLNGTLEVLDATAGSTLNISGASGSVHDFTVKAGNARASATITAHSGDLTFNGTGNVISESDATLNARAEGNLNLASTAALSAELQAEQPGDQLQNPFPFFMAMSSDPNLAQVNLESGAGKVVTNAGSSVSANASDLGDAEINLLAASGMTVNGNVASESAGGNAAVALRTSGDDASIVQASGGMISAKSTGVAGDASVDIQAGDCCKANATLNGSVEAVVENAGNASVAIRGNNVTVKHAKANVLGSGDALLDVAAPSSIAVTGTINVQAADIQHRADVKLISDKLTYSGGKAIMSKGNSYVQLAAFDTRRVTGVYSGNDFDAEVQTNYDLPTLQKFMGNKTEIKFGGEYDRSAWTKESDPLEYCLPGMANWGSTLQQTADIHVAGNGRLNLGDVKMVFDTTGTTYYHDNQMSAWSVPEGRIAVFVARPGNIDRYLDRTDNTLQTMTEAIEDAPANSATTGAEFGAPVAGATLIQGKLFMDGDGVNTGTQVASASGTDSANGTGAADKGNGVKNAGNEAGSSSGDADNDGQAKDPDERRKARGNRN